MSVLLKFIFIATCLSNHSITLPLVGVQNIVMSVSVFCLYVYLSAHIFQRPHVQTSRIFCVCVNCGHGSVLCWQ